MTELMNKLRDKTAKLGVIGLGYVGLPLAVEKARAGYHVLGFDVQDEKVNKVNRGENYIGDIVPEELNRLVETGFLAASSDFGRIAECDVVTICVPTPLDEFKQPDLSYIEASAKEIAPRLHQGMLVVLESTTYPGTTEEVVKPILESTGLSCGRDFLLAFSPERVDPGNAQYKTHNTPKVVGGCGPESAAAAQLLYETILGAPVFMVSSPKEAEAAKILENTFRIVNCALANEMALVFHRMGINVWEVISAAATKPFGFMPFYPGPGIGGHCIPLDPFYLTYKARAYDYHTRLIELSGEINDAMPDYVVERLMELLNDRSKALKGSKILLLGLAYKGDIDDLRESPSLKIWDLLERKGATVAVCDPYCSTVRHGGKTVTPAEMTDELIESCDAVLVVTGHKKRVDYARLAAKAKLIFDTRNIVAPSLHKPVEEIKGLYIL